MTGELSFKKRLKPGLREMTIRGECHRNILGSHNFEGNAIDQTPFFVE